MALGQVATAWHTTIGGLASNSLRFAIEAKAKDTAEVHAEFGLVACSSVLVC